MNIARFSVAHGFVKQVKISWWGERGAGERFKLLSNAGIAARPPSDMKDSKHTNLCYF